MKEVALPNLMLAVVDDILDKAVTGRFATGLTLAEQDEAADSL